MDANLHMSKKPELLTYIQQDKYFGGHIQPQSVKAKSIPFGVDWPFRYRSLYGIVKSQKSPTLFNEILRNTCPVSKFQSDEVPNTLST